MTSSERVHRLPLIKPNAWPSQLRLQWERAHEPRQSLFGPAQAAADWQPATLRQVEQGMGKLLAVLRADGVWSDQLDLDAVVTRVWLQCFVEKLLAEGLQFSTCAAYLNGVGLGARAMAPCEDWRWIGYALGRLRARIPRRSLAVDSRVTTAMLLEAGKRVFAAAIADVMEPEVVRARRARDGLIVAFLSLRQLRRANLSALMIGTHILFDGDGYKIRMSQHEMKMDKRGYDADWPEALTGELAVYLERFRPILLRQLKDPCNKRAAGEALWVSERGTMMDDTGIYKQVRKLVHRELGEHLNLHRFRHIAACTIAMHRPEFIDVVSEVLGHTDPRSREIYTRGADQLLAVRRSHRLEDQVVHAAGARGGIRA